MRPTVKATGRPVAFTVEDLLGMIGYTEHAGPGELR
jgi:hypothetical protein